MVQWNMAAYLKGNLIGDNTHFALNHDFGRKGMRYNQTPDFHGFSTALTRTRPRTCSVINHDADFGHLKKSTPSEDFSILPVVRPVDSQFSLTKYALREFPHGKHKS